MVDHAKGHLSAISKGNSTRFFGGIVTVSVGHANPRLTEKVKAQIDKVQHTSTAHLTESTVSLAEKMAQIAPGKLRKSYFSNSGSEANEVAVITARMYTGNHEVLALRHGYSGHTQLTKSMTGMFNWRKSGVMPHGVVQAPGPYCYRCPYGLTYLSCDLLRWRGGVIALTSGSIAAMLAETIRALAASSFPPG